jgi:hypothetical protein
MRYVETMYSRHASESRGRPKSRARGDDQARMMVNVSGSRARGSSSVALSPAPYVIQAAGRGGARGG